MNFGKRDGEFLPILLNAVRLFLVRLICAYGLVDAIGHLAY